MEDDLQKSNTDCVYFLASPLTCKKGRECEYRHSESARLNPRDCWYWLSGNCLNPACVFRHPPLDGQPEGSYEPVNLHSHVSVAAGKTNVPCYFFHNGYCMKGDKCQYLHGSNEILSTTKFAKTALTVTDSHPLENKNSTKSETRIESVEAPLNPSQRTSRMPSVEFQYKDVQLEAPQDIIEHSPSTQNLVSNCEEAAVMLSDTTPSAAADFIDCSRRSPVSLDHSSEEEQTDTCVEPEERWESSPGFDVLVDDGLEDSGFEDRAEYLAACDGEPRRLHNQLLQYDYKEPVGYDQMDYPPDTDILYEHGIYDSYDHLENDYPSDYIPAVPDHLRETMLEPSMFGKRRLLPRELEVNNRNCVDLRDHLRKRQRDGYYDGSPGSRKHRSTHVHDNHVFHGRLASEVGKNMIRSHRDSESGSRRSNRSGQKGHSHSKSNRRREERRQSLGRLPSLGLDISRGLPMKVRKPMPESITFTGPKTLAQIKEEKRRAREGGDDARNVTDPAIRCSSRTTSEDFQGPRPLNELIKNKGRPHSASDTSIKPVEKKSSDEHAELSFPRPVVGGNGHLDEDARTGYHGISEKKFQVDSDSYDDDDDDDGLEKKLAGILS